VHRFYPVFPVPLELASEVVLDVTHSEGLRFDGGKNENGDALEYAPDVIIIPSRLKQFVKVCLAVARGETSFRN
jgi:DNA polymerase alpha subunit B